MKILLVPETNEYDSHFAVYDVTNKTDLRQRGGLTISQLGSIFPDNNTFLANLVSDISIKRELLVFDDNHVGVLFTTRDDVNGDELLTRLFEINEQRKESACRDDEERELRISILNNSGRNKANVSIEIMRRDSTQFTQVISILSHKKILFAIANKFQQEIFVGNVISVRLKVSDSMIDRLCRLFEVLEKVSETVDLGELLKKPTLENLERFVSLQKLLR
jgi:hypothetical protein